MNGIRTGGTAHRLLSVACAEPLTYRELQDRADQRYGPHHWNSGVGTMACLRLNALGLLERTRCGQGRTPSRYTLHPLGEHLLDEMDVLHRTVGAVTSGPDLPARLATLIRSRAAHNATADELGLLGELAAPVPSARLTPQQARLLPLLLEGQSMKLCGKALDISPDTVKDHAVQVYRKYGVRSRSALIARFGWQPAPEVHP